MFKNNIKYNLYNMKKTIDKLNNNDLIKLIKKYNLQGDKILIEMTPFY